MVPSPFQTLAILVVLHVYALAEPQDYVRYNHYNGILTLPPRKPENINTVSPVTKPAQKNSLGDTDKPNKDSPIDMNVPDMDKNAPQMTPTVPSTPISPIAPQLTSSKSPQSGQPDPSVEPANSENQDSKSRLAAPPSRRVKKISMTGSASSKEEQPVTRQRAMTLPR